MTARNQSNVWEGLPPNGPSDFAYAPTSHQLFEFLVDSAGTNAFMQGVDVVSGTQETFAFTCPSGHNAAIMRMNLLIIDGSITPTKFGGLAALDNGVRMEHLSNDVGSREVLKDYTPGFTIKKNADWTVLAGVDGAETIAVAGDDIFAMRWSIFRSGLPTFLKDGEQLSFTLQDSTTGITEMCAMVQGIVYPDQ